VVENYPDTFSPEYITEEFYTWCWLMITTRAFGNLPYTSLIPMAELFNHGDVMTVYTYGKEDNIPESASQLE